MRLVTWNIRQGGGPSRLPEIALALLDHGADVCLLTEFRVARGGALRAILADHGLEHQVVGAGLDGGNSILLASRWPVQPMSAPAPAFPPGRWIDARIDALDLTLTGVHIPDDSRRAEKAACWRHLIDLARQRAAGGWIVLGDVNSGRHAIDEDARTFTATPLLGTFSTLGMLDAWRHLHPQSRERSWAHPARGGTRIDACYLSTGLHKCLKTSHFSHAERERGLSDHSLLVVEVDAPATAIPAQNRAKTGLFAPSPPHNPGTKDGADPRRQPKKQAKIGSVADGST